MQLHNFLFRKDGKIIMHLKINKIIKYIVLYFTLISLCSCRGQNVKFNFSGRKVLYSDISERKSELVLLNLDTNEKITFDKFDEVELNNYILFNNAKNILVDGYNSRSGKVYIYDIIQNKSIDIDINSKNNEMSGFYNVSICGNNFYFNSDNKIFAHSLEDFSLLKIYNTDSDILQFAVYDSNLIAVIHSKFEEDENRDTVSNMYLYDFINKEKKEIPYQAYPLDWSKDRKNLLFLCGGLKIMEYPACIVYPLDSLQNYSLSNPMGIHFISNNEIIFSGYQKGKENNSTNLYILDLKSNKTRQITNSNTEKEIKSTCY